MKNWKKELAVQIHLRIAFGRKLWVCANQKNVYLSRQQHNGLWNGQLIAQRNVKPQFSCVSNVQLLNALHSTGKTVAGRLVGNLFIGSTKVAVWTFLFFFPHSFSLFTCVVVSPDDGFFSLEVGHRKDRKSHLS